MMTTEKTVLIEAENLKSLRMYELVNNSVLLLDPLSGEWYSVPTGYVRGVESPWRDPWPQTAVARLVIDEDEWSKNRGTRDIYLRSPYDCGGVLVQTDAHTYAMTWDLYDDLLENICDIEKDRPKDTENTFHTIKIILSDPDLIESDDYESGRDPIVLYRAAEAELDRLDIPF